MSEAVFQYEVEDGGRVTLQLLSRKLHGTRLTAFSDWASLTPSSIAALAHIIGAAEEGRSSMDGAPLVEIGEHQVHLHADFVASLPSSSAAELGLPPPTSLAIDLRSEGLITEPSFAIEARWVRPGGAPARTQVIGPFVRQDGQLRRVPEPLYGLWRAAANLKAPQPDAERMAALAEITRLLPAGAQAAVQANGYLQDLRIHYASGFSLKVGRGGPFDFDPVLFSRRAVAEAAEGIVLDEDADSILAPSVQRAFAEDRFRASAHARAAYVLRDGGYVFIDPALRPALDVVRKLQDAPDARRREFLSNPRRTIRDALDESTQGEIDDLFIETEQFSQRVAGVDVWRTPVLPWLKQQPNTWLPETFGVRVGEDYVVISPERVELLVAAVSAAIDSGQATVEIDGKVLPATPQTLEALQALRPLVEELARDDGAAAPRPDPRPHSDKLFLIVRENFEEVAYAPLERKRPAELAPPTLPASVRTPLKPHQAKGFEWLAKSLLCGASGVLLADDMGLGKTLQGLAFLAWLQAQMRSGERTRRPALIVAPTGLLANWREEIEKHLRDDALGDVVLAFGSSLRLLRDEDALNAKDIDAGKAALRSESWRSAGVVLTTYETMRDYHLSFARTRFSAVLFDEAQKLKNPASQITRAAKTLNAEFMIGMTGTPVENRLQDLWSIMDVLSPGLLGASKEFDKRYPSHDTAALDRLRKLLSEDEGERPAHMLRRLKSDHLPGLPSKTVRAERLKMPPRQADAYMAVLKRALAIRDSRPSQGAMLQTLHALRGVSLHPIDPTSAPGDLDAYAQDSARLRWAVEILERIKAKNEKALIFLESLAMQERLAALIQRKFALRSLPHRIHGGVPGIKRQELVRTFQASPNTFDVMILSPKAGGVGLTLTAANHVIHLSRWWNPAVEDQSTDRVYRIGQEKEVFVYLPLAEHPDPAIGPMSFDVRLHDLVERKRTLSQHMLAPPEADAAEVSQLFEAISGDAMSLRAGEAVAQPAPPAAVESAPTPNAKRPDLDAHLQIKRWRIPPGGPRPLEEMLAPFVKQRVKHLRVLDPYAIADPRARRAQAAFLGELLKRAAAVEAVTIEYCASDEAFEDERRQRVDMNQRLLAVGSRSPPRISLRCRPGRRDGGSDFHDRATFIDCEVSNGEVETHELSVERGLIGLMNEELQCTATYVAPSVR